jgi:protein TonB
MIFLRRRILFNRFDLKWTIIASLLIHWSLFNFLHIEQQAPLLKKLDIELIMEIVKPKPKIEPPPPKPVVKQPPPPPKPVVKQPPPPPKPVVKQPPPPPKPVVKQPPPPPKPTIKDPEPLVEPVSLPTEDTIPIEKPEIVEEAVLNKTDPVVEAKMIEDYATLLAAHISQFKRYPRIAQRRGWEGDVMIEIRMDSKGSILTISLLEKSQYQVLDDEAIKMIERAKPFPAPQKSISDTFTVFVPVKFGLK